MRRILMAVSLGAIFALMMIGGASAADGNTVAGNSVIDRPELDGWTDFYLVDKNNSFDLNGTVTQWEVYARNTNQVQLVIYRNSGGWSVVGTSDAVTPVVGYNLFTLGSSISVRAGDYVGLHFPGSASVPFTLSGAFDFGEGNLTGTVLQTHQGGGQTAFALSSNRRYSVRALGPTGASSGTTVGGNNVIDRPNTDGWTNTYLVDKNHSFNSAGTLRSWEIWARNTNQVQLVIYRYSNGWSVVGTSNLVTPATGYNRFSLSSPIDVHAGDYIGLHFPGAGSVAFSLSGDFTLGEGNLSGSVLQTHEDRGQTDFAVSSNRVYSVRASSASSGGGTTDVNRGDGDDNGRGIGHQRHGNGLGLGHEQHGNGLGLGHEKHGDGQGDDENEDEDED